jgi:hypothetical protein
MQNGQHQGWFTISVISTTTFSPAFNLVSPAKLFRHQGQSGTAGHGLVWYCPAMPLDKYYYCKLADRIAIFRFSDSYQIKKNNQSSGLTKLSDFILD